MFVQLNPDVASYSETISTLKFAVRVSGVELGAARSNREGRDVRELMEQVTFLFYCMLVYANTIFFMYQLNKLNFGMLTFVHLGTYAYASSFLQ